MEAPDNIVGGVDDCAMAFKLTFCAGSGSFGYGCVGMHAEVEGLSRVLGEEIHGNIYAGEASRLGWPSPPQISTHRIVPAGGIDWRVMGRTRPITEEGGRAYFITEYLVCDPEEAGRLAGQEITPADILLIRDQTDLWFVGDRWDQPAQYYQKPLELVKPGQPANPARNVVIQVPSETDLPSMWPRLAPQPGDANSPLFPFQHTPCCWLADRNRQVGEEATGLGCGGVSFAMTLDTDGLLCLFNESSRALAKIGMQLEEDPGRESEWLGTPWKVTFTTFALARDQWVDYEWVGCWRGVEGHRSFLAQAESNRSLLDLDAPGHLDPNRLQENLLKKRWIPGAEEPELEVESDAIQPSNAPIPVQPMEPTQETAVSVGSQAKTDGSAGAKSFPGRSREKAIENKKVWGTAGALLGCVLLVLLLAFGTARIRKDSQERAIAGELKKYFDGLSSQVESCEAKIIDEKKGYADYDGLKKLVRAGDVPIPGTPALESLLEEAPSAGDAGENESDDIKSLRKRISDKEKEARGWIAVCDDYEEWKEKLVGWALTETIDTESVPATLGRHPTNKDDLRIRAVVRAVNQVIEADDARALGTERETSLQTTLRNSVAGAGRPFQEILEKIAEKAQELAREKVGSWKGDLTKEAEKAYAAADEPELTNVLDRADALVKGAGEWMDPGDVSPVPGRNQWLTEWKGKLDKEVPVDDSANDQRERHQKLLVFLKGHAGSENAPEGFAAGLAEIEKRFPLLSVVESNVPLVLNSGSAEKIRFELPIPEGFDLKRIQFIRPNFANFSVDTTTIDGPDSIFVPYTPEEIPGQDESWQGLRYSREIDTVRLVGKTDFSLFGGLERGEENGFATFTIENSGVFKTDFAILEVGPIEGAVQPTPEVAETNVKPRFFLLGKGKNFVLNDLPADRFFEGRKNEEIPGNELRIVFDSQAHHWSLVISVYGGSDSISVPRLDAVKTKLEEVVETVARSISISDVMRKKLAAENDQCVKNFHNSLLEVDLFAGVKRLRVEMKKEWRGEAENRQQVDVEILTLADDSPGYSYRQFLKGERNPFSNKQGLVQGYRSNYYKTLFSYGKNAFETFLTLFAENEDLSENEAASRAIERIFYFNIYDRKRLSETFGRVSGLDNFVEFFGLLARGGSGSGGGARVQNARIFVLQWQKFASLLSQGDTKEFFAIERGFPDRNLANPDADLDKIRGLQQNAGGGGPGITPEMLMGALKSPYEKLNELVKITRLQLVGGK